MEHVGAVTCVSIAKKHVVSGSNTGAIIVWDINSGEPIQRLKGHCKTITALGLTENGLYIVSGKMFQFVSKRSCQQIRISYVTDRRYVIISPP